MIKKKRQKGFLLTDMYHMPGSGAPELCIALPEAIVSDADHSNVLLAATLRAHTCKLCIMGIPQDLICMLYCLDIEEQAGF